VGISLLFVAVAGVIPSFHNGGWRGIVCADFDTRNRAGWVEAFRGICSSCGNPAVRYLASACAAQAFFQTFGAFCFASWWMAIAIHAAVTVLVPNRDIFSFKTQLLTHVVCWGGPVVFIIACLSLATLTSTKALPWCGFTALIWVTTGQNWVLQFLWVFLCLLVGSIAVGIVMIFMIKAARGSSFFWTKNVRLLLFMFLLVAVLAYRIGFRVNQWNALAYIIAGSAGWKECNLHSDNCGIPNDTENVVLVWLLTLTEFGTGIATAVLFLASKGVWVGFWRILSRKDSPLASTTEGTTTSNASSSGGSSTTGSEQMSSWMSD